MRRAEIVAVTLALASTVGAFGCVDGSEADIEVVRSAFGGFGPSCPAGGTAGTSDTLGVRAFTQANGLHVADFRAAGTQDIRQASGTPFGTPVGVAGGALSGSSPWAYKRHDGASAVLYIDILQHVHEITAVAGNVDLFNAFGLNAPNAAVAPVGGPAPDVIGYVRTDNRSAIVYRSTTNHVIELKSNFGSQPPWLVTDLTTASNAQVTATMGSAFPYVRSDGWNTIVYIGSDNHIHELATQGSGWSDGDLSNAAGSSAVPSTEPWGYRRSDSCNSVVFVGTDNILHELALCGGGWGSHILPATTPVGGLFARPSGYLRADGLNAVAYVSSTSDPSRANSPSRALRELQLTAGTTWMDVALPMSCISPLGQPFAHPAPGNRSSILFQGRAAVGGFINRYELSQPNGGAWGLQAF